MVLPCYQWTFRILPSSVENTIRRGVQPPVPKTPRSTSASILLMKFSKWAGTSQDVSQVLTAAFDADDYLDCIKDLQARNIEPLLYINSLDKVSLHRSQSATFGP